MCVCMYIPRAMADHCTGIFRTPILAAKTTSIWGSMGLLLRCTQIDRTYVFAAFKLTNAFLILIGKHC